MKNLAAALVKAQSELPAIHKDAKAEVTGKTKDGKFYKYSYGYVSLPAVLEAVLPVLNKHGIALIQAPTFLADTGGMVLKTVLMHGESGEMFEAQAPLKTAGSPQDIGGEITYARRYAITSLLGIAADEDNDGAAVSKSAREKQSTVEGGGQAPAATPAPKKPVPKRSGAKPAVAPDPDFDRSPDLEMIDVLGEIDVLADALAIARHTDKTSVLKALTDEYKDWRTDPIDVHRAKARLVMWGEKLKEASAA